MTDHLSREQLLCYIDGELSKSGMVKAADHLHSCWACRAEVERLQGHITDIFDAAAEVFEPSLPPPPRPWPGLESRLREAAKKSHKTALWQRLLTPGSWAPKTRLAFAASAAILIVIVLTISLQPARIMAAEALRRSAEADGRRLAIAPGQVIRQRVHVKKTRRLAPGEDKATFEAWKTVKSAYWEATEPVPAELMGRYRDIGLDAGLPLSPAVQESWLRLAVAVPTASRNDGAVEVQAVANDAGRAHGLEQVAFRMRESDWHLDQVTLAYTDATYQITEKDSSILEHGEVPGNVLAMLEPASPAAMPGSATPVGLHSVFPSADLNLDDMELSVRSDLHSLKADLGESIEVSTRGRSVLVNAWNISSKRKSELAARLANKPWVLLEFQPPAGGTGTGSRTVVIPESVPTMQPVDERLRKFFGSEEAGEDFTRSALKASTGVLAHFYALRALADRWPAGRDIRLSAESKSRLLGIIADHGREVQTGIVEMKDILNPLLGNFGRQIQFEGAESKYSSWQEASAAGLSAAIRADQVLRSLLTASESRISLDEALPALQQTVRDIEGIALGFRFN